MICCRICAQPSLKGSERYLCQSPGGMESYTYFLKIESVFLHKSFKFCRAQIRVQNVNLNIPRRPSWLPRGETSTDSFWLWEQTLIDTFLGNLLHHQTQYFSIQRNFSLHSLSKPYAQMSRSNSWKVRISEFCNLTVFELVAMFSWSPSGFCSLLASPVILSSQSWKLQKKKCVSFTCSTSKKWNTHTLLATGASQSI